MSKDKPETLEEQLMRHGIKDAPPDHPAYQMGWSIEFVPPGRLNTQNTPPPSQPENAPATPPPETASPSGENRENSLIRHLADLSVVLNRRNPHPASVRMVLRRAMQDGLDWRDLYQKGLHCRQGMPWLDNDPAPLPEEVNPEIP